MEVIDKRARSWVLMGIKAKAATRLGDENGAVLILTGLMLVALMGISALVIDIGNAGQRGRTAQNISDASVLAGGWELPTNADAKTVAGEYVADNLDVTLPSSETCPAEDDVTANTVCYEVGTRTIQITSPWANNDYMVRVEVYDNVETTFAKVIGFTTMTVCRYAIAEGEPPYPGSPGGPAIQAFGQADKKAFETTGSGTIWTDGDIFIASVAGEAFVASGSGGVLAEGNVWYDSTGGGCALPPHCGDPGFLNSSSWPVGTYTPEELALGNLPVGCDPTDPAAADYCGGADFFYDVYVNHPIRSIVFSDLAQCLVNGLNSSGCESYYWDTAPVHTIHNELGTTGPFRTGDTDNPSCDDGSATMDPGFYSTTGQYSIQACVIMNPGIYMFAGGFDVEAAAYLRGNNVLLINAHANTVSRFTKSAACLTGLTAGPFENFLYYQNPDNDNTFDIESDSSLFLAGIIYIPNGEGRIQGASAGTGFGGDGTPGSGCLGETTLLGGSLVAKEVLVKSDGILRISAFPDSPATGGGDWVRLYE